MLTTEFEPLMLSKLNLGVVYCMSYIHIFCFFPCARICGRSSAPLIQLDRSFLCFIIIIYIFDNFGSQFVFDGNLGCYNLIEDAAIVLNSWKFSLLLIK